MGEGGGSSNLIDSGIGKDARKMYGKKGTNGVKVLVNFRILKKSIFFAFFNSLDL